VKIVSSEIEMPKSQERLTLIEVDEGYCLACISKPMTILTTSEFAPIEEEEGYRTLNYFEY
jgi:hypothetical protein